MIRTHATVNTNPIDATIALVRDHTKILQAAGQRAHDRVAPEALADLRREPGPVKQPIVWASDAQRRYVMMIYRQKGIKDGYERSHQLSQAWTFVAVFEGQIFRAVIENPAPQAKFVYGSLAQSRAAALRFKQKMHAATGWQDATDTATKWTRTLLEVFRKEYTQEIRVRRRAYTQGSKRR